ncbi:MAG: ribosome biogenesis GTPase YlqF, partial [Oscillospiraceae bacterium]|nr:ribosome biogenesis GTPase YlqF [Oscillospiraceae bacterium]
MDKINWFPGHMAKTIREVKTIINMVDAVIDIRDARIVFSSSIPNIKNITNNKPRLILLNKSDLADKNITNRFLKYLKSENTLCLEVNSLTGMGINNIKKNLQELL